MNMKAGSLDGSFNCLYKATESLVGPGKLDTRLEFAMQQLANDRADTIREDFRDRFERLRSVFKDDGIQSAIERMSESEQEEYANQIFILFCDIATSTGSET